MGKSNKIITALHAISVILGIGLLCFTTYLSFFYIYKQSQIIPHYEEVLTTKGKEYVQNVMAFFDAQKEISSKLAAQLGESVKTLNSQDLKDSDAQATLTGIRTKTNEFLTQMQENAGFKNIMLVKITGDVVFMLHENKYLGTNLRQKPISLSSLGLSYLRAQMMLVSDISQFNYDEILKTPALFISLPIFFEKILQGVLIVQVDHDRIYHMSQDYLALGKTGEIITAEQMGGHAQIIAPARLNPHIAFKKSGLQEPGVKIPLQEAVNGRTGIGFGYDYRKMYMLAYWDYIPDVDWGFDVKIDYDEMLELHQELKQSMLLFILITLIFWLILSFSFAGFRLFLREIFNKIRQKVTTQHIALYTSLLLFIITSTSGTYLFYILRQSEHQALQKAKSNAKRVSMEAVTNIQHDLDKVASIASAMCSYLNDTKVSQEDVTINLNRKINEEPTLFAFITAYHQPEITEETPINSHVDILPVSQEAPGQYNPFLPETIRYAEQPEDESNENDSDQTVQPSQAPQATTPQPQVEQLPEKPVVQQPTAKTQTFAPYATRKEGKAVILQLEDILKETTHDTSFMTQDWFREATEKKKGVWIQPRKELLTGTWVVTYAEPFYGPDDKDKEVPLGVVAAMYAVDNIKPMLANLVIGETGYPSIVNKKGKFVYHPIEKYNSKITLFSEAKLTDNLPLSLIDKKIVDGQTGIEPYFGLYTNRMMWVSYQPIEPIGWSLVLRFVEQEITPPAEQAHHERIWIIICAVLSLIFLTIIFISIWSKTQLRTFAFMSAPIFIIGILSIWRLVEPNFEVKNGIVIYNEIGLDTYLEELIKNARQRHEKEPLLLPTGMFIESWSIAPTKVDITGTVWQIYNDQKHKGLAQEINFPDATNMKTSNPYKHKVRDNTTAGSNINATLSQVFDFSKFPLDSQRIRIMMDHKDLEKNVLLIPDLASYDNISPSELPGLDKTFQYYGFSIKRSFFSLEKTKENTDFGVQMYSNVSEHIKLLFNIVITRDIMNSLIVYFMPLLVILISLFAIFAVTGRIGRERKTFVSIASYTGLLFALVALNTLLRTQYPSGTILYIEYFFFYTYMTILILIVHGAFVQTESYQEFIDEKITPAMKNLFWPVQLAVWFITTVLVFYNI